MTNQRQTHHFVIVALLGLVAALFVPAAFIAALAFTGAAIGLDMTRRRRLVMPSRVRAER